MGLLSTEEQNTQIKKIEKNGIIFITETETIEMKRRIDELSKAYTTKKKEIARFMLENGILEYYGDMTAEQLIQYLGRPTIRPEMDQISYCEQMLDTDHVFSLEYDGMIENLAYFSIDG